MRSLAAILAGAIAALAAWPAAVSHFAAAPSFTPAPLVRDYVSRDAFVSFYEREVRGDGRNQIAMRTLAGLYLQRFREQYDPSDIARAQHWAERSIQLQPQGNTNAQMTLASALLAYHDFRGALGHERDARRGEPSNAAAIAQIASAQLELGRYGEARSTLEGAARGPAENPSVDAVRARLDELTGDLAGARGLIDASIRAVDSDTGAAAYDRSWFHLRAGQLAFESGDFNESQAQLAQSLADFPNDAAALLWQARLYRAQARWRDALAAASRSAELYPLPQALGYKADAQRALGDEAGARETDALIDAERRLFDARGVNDRLLALYYAQRREHLGAALAAARSDYRKRGDEIYADDTLAWVLATMGRWGEARTYAERAARLHTQDPQLQYHAAVIALHTGHPQEAQRRLEAALATNPAFDPIDAPQAYRILADLRK